MKIVEILYKYNLVTWETLYNGWENNRIDKKIIIQHAIKEIEKGNDSDEIYFLAGADHEEIDIIKEYLDKIIKKNQINHELENKKWLLSFLQDLSENSLSINEKIERLQIIYSDFGYPEIMKSCSIYYIPQNNENDQQVIDQIIDPLEEMEKVIQKLKKTLMPFK